MVPIVSREDCRKNYGEADLITSNMLCAGLRGAGKDACQGDSGGKSAPVLLSKRH